MSSKIYKLGDGRDAITVLKWLRQRGERGRDWEFAGGYTNANFWFQNEKLELAYILRWE